MGGSNDLSLKVILSAQDQASGALKGFGSTLVNLAGDAGPLLGGMLAISAAAIGFGAASVQAAAQYQQQMNMVQALTGASQDQMNSYDSQLKQLAMDAGVAPTQLAQGLYNVLSAGFQGADAMNVLTLATKDAKIGMTDADTTGKALSKMLYGFSVPASQFNEVNGEMLKTVTLGSMSMKDYAGAISKSIPVAIQYKDSMENMNAVIATISPVTKSAAVASTDYNNLLKVLNGNTAAVSKSAEKLNPHWNANAFAAMNVHDKVAYLNKMIVQHGHNISEVIGKQQNAAQAFTILATHSDAYSQNLQKLSDKQANAKATGDQWAITQGGFNQQLSRASASVQTLMIDIGQNLLPVLTKLVGAVAPAVTWLINFASATSKNQVAMDFIKGALAGFALLLIMVLVPAFISWAVAAGAAAIATLAATWPLLLIAAGVALLIAGLMLLIQHWKQVSDFLSGLWKRISQGFQDDVVKPFGNMFNHLGTGFHDDVVVPIGNLFNNLGTTIHDTINNIGTFFSNLGKTVHDTVNSIGQWFQDLPGNIVKSIDNLVSQGEKKFRDFWNNVVKDAKSILSNIGTAIGDGFKSAIDFLFIDPINGIINGVNNVTSKIGVPAIPHIPRLALGGDIIGAGSVLVGENGPEVLNLPSGASVVPLSGSSASRSTSGNVYNSVVVYGGNGNPQQIADMVMDRLNRLYRRSGLMGNPAVGARSS